MLVTSVLVSLVACCGGKVAYAQEEVSVGKLRASADAAFAAGEVDKATKLMSQVIDLERSNEKNYYKRFRMYLRQQKYKEALSDLSAALSIKPDYDVVAAHRAKLHLRLGKCREATQDFHLLRSIAPTNPDLVLMDRAAKCAAGIQAAQESVQRGDCHSARAYIRDALAYTEFAAALLLQSAQCAYLMGDFYEAVADTGKAIKIEPDSIAALELRGRAYYRLGEHDMAMNHWRQALKYDPEHKGCKEGYRKLKQITKLQDKANRAIAGRNWGDAKTHLSELSEVDVEHTVFRIPILVQLADVLLKGNEPGKARQAAQDAVNLDENSAAAHIKLGEVLLELEKYEEAVQEYKRAVGLAQDDTTARDGLQRAEAALKQSKEKNYYKILEVHRNADKQTIKQAYKELALQWHPDKHSGEEAKEAAERRFQLIAEAYEVLSDPELRSKYDRGEDVFQNQGGEGPQRHPFAHHGGTHFHFPFG